MCDSTDEETAYHEAGHALMAIKMGGRVESVSIAPDYDDGPLRYGDAMISWPAKFNEKELVEKSILVSLAGPVAEMIHRQEPLHPGFVPEWANDWQQAWELAESVRRDTKQRLAYLEDVTRQVHGFLNRDDVWDKLARIVDHLLAYERLEGDEINDWL